jgi:pimeloyl-ACP methyl ester carboxylesterase
MTDTELRALTALGFDELREATAGLGSIHHAVAGRVFRAIGPSAALVRPVHEAITRGVYAGLGLGARAIGLAAQTAVARRDAPKLSTTPRGSALIAAVTGLRGDALEAEGSPLCQPMAVRVNGEPVALDTDALRVAFPEATPRLVVFLHGLMETEFSWGDHRGAAGSARGLRKASGRTTYGERLARELACTPVYVRYNSGRHISENGRSLSELMEKLVAAWPGGADEIALVGHSMGGLVARSACCYAAQGDADWVRLVSHSVSLGSPHLGAPLEQAVHVLSAGLAALPETRPVANLLRRRSGGIRDLRQGSLVDEDWRDRDPDALRAAACAEVPLLEGATHCFVSATITRSDRHPLGRLLGDTLVLVPSASGRSRTRRIPFDEEYGMHVGGATHFALLNHPAVYERLRDWLAVAPRPV